MKALHFRIHRDFFSVFIFSLEFHKAINECKYRVVLAYADIVARVCGSASLADDDIARPHELAAVFLNA